MPFVSSLVGSVVVFVFTAGICVFLIRAKKLPKFISWIQRREVWKCYDFIWYGSGLVALTAFWMAQVENAHRAELDDLTIAMQIDASAMEGAMRSASIFCDVANHSNDLDSQISRICFWVSGTLGLIQSQGTNALYPSVPITQTVGQIEDWPTGSGESLSASGMAIVTTDWTLLGATLYQAIFDLHELAQRDDVRILLPNPQSVPNGVMMDGRLERINSLRTEIIPDASPLNIQGIWWLYVFACLIGLKISKTYAEIRLS